MTAVDQRRRGYHRDDNGDPWLRDSLVLFVDVLGAQAMTSGDAQRALVTLDRAIASVRPLAEDTVPDAWYFSAWFSDNMALGSPIPTDRGQGEPELGAFIHVASGVQLQLALDGIFTRGGLTRGDHFMDENITFGPALVEAVSIEKVSADYPRILLGDSAVALAQGHLRCYGQFPEGAWHNNDLWVDLDGNVFVNYLNSILNFVGETIREAEELVDRHRQHVRDRLHRYADDPRVLRKYMWLAGYHNRFCAVHRIPEFAVVEPVPNLAFRGFGERATTPFNYGDHLRT